VGALGLVELERAGECIQHGLGDPAEVSPLQAGVVVDAHPGQQRDFFPAEPWNAPVAAVGGQACLLRRDPGSPGV
jgi:hypothetical protein